MLDWNSRFMRVARAGAASAALLTAGHALAATVSLQPGTPANASSADLASHGFIEQEFFLAGQANAYTEAGTWRKDGVWPIKLAKTQQPYRTRLLVRHPKDPARFNGTVVVEWLNVTGFIDAEIDGVYMIEELLAKGYAWVGVSAQKAGVDGIKKADAARYGSLDISDDALSYDIFTEAARTIRAQHATLLGGLQPRRLLATGQSQSALRMLTYVNTLALTEKQYDAYLIHSRGSFPAGIDSFLGSPLVAQVRTDLDVPVFQLETEFDTGPALFSLARQPDTPKLRTWEVAGAGHIDQYAIDRLTVAGIGNASSFPLHCAKPINKLPFYRVEKAVLRHLHTWMTEGKAPPSAPPIAMANGAFQRDAMGNAKGGVRLPEMDVPLTVQSLSNGPAPRPESTTPTSGAATGTEIPGGAAGNLLSLLACTFLGASAPLTPEQLKGLYASRNDYVARYTAAARAAVKAGFLLPEDAEAGIAEAVKKAQALPLP